jgi:hypothetical protein
MAAGRKRYDPLRQAEREAQNQSQGAEPAGAEPSPDVEERHITDQHASRGVADPAPHRPTSPPRRALIPPMSQDRETLEAFANDYDKELKRRYKERFEAQQEIEQGQQPPPHSSESRDAVSKGEHPRSYADLKNEHSKPPERDEPSVEQTRGTQQESLNPGLAPNQEIQRRLDAKAAIEREGAEVNQLAHTQAVPRPTDARPAQNYQPKTDKSTSRDIDKIQKPNDGERHESNSQENPEIQRRRDAKTAIENDLASDGSSRTKQPNQKEPELATNERTFQRSGRDDDR